MTYDTTSQSIANSTKPKHVFFLVLLIEFFIACLVLGLEYLHSKSTLHRDIKPENLVFDEEGFLHLTDLGIAKQWQPDNAKDTSGTPGYMAPEVMCRQNHGVAVDYFAVGIITFECMYGKVSPDEVLTLLEAIPGQKQKGNP